MSFAIKKQGEIAVVDVEGQLIVGSRQELKKRVLDEGLRVHLKDNALAWQMDSDGVHHRKRHRKARFSGQQRLPEKAANSGSSPRPFTSASPPLLPSLHRTPTPHRAPRAPHL